MLKFICLVGISGSGKSTIAEKLKKEEEEKGNKIVILSSDTLRAQILGDINDQTQNSMIFQELHKRTLQSLLNGVSVVYDATSINIKDRKSILDKIKNVDCYKVAYVMTCSYQMCKTQNQSRDRVVPDFVLEKQLRKFQIPIKYEGFDEIVLDKWNDFSNCTSENLFPIIQKMIGFNQRTKWHKHSLLDHCLATYEEIKKGTTNKPLLVAAIIHDFGKLYTGKQKEDGDYCYYSHENVGTYHLLQNLDLFGLNNVDDVLECLFYVNYHMLPFSLNNNKTHLKYKTLFGEKLYDNLIFFNECDKIASGTE
jgi:predicted kinase